MSRVTEQGEAEPDLDSFVRTQVPYSFHSTMAAGEHRKIRTCLPSWVPKGSCSGNSWSLPTLVAQRPAACIWEEAGRMACTPGMEGGRPAHGQ